MFKNTQDEIIKMNNEINDPMKKGKARDLELFKRKVGIVKSDPEVFH